jgi:hypothetical protein
LQPVDVAVGATLCVVVRPRLVGAQGGFSRELAGGRGIWWAAFSTLVLWPRLIPRLWLIVRLRVIV